MEIQRYLDSTFSFMKKLKSKYIRVFVHGYTANLMTNYTESDF